MRYVGYMNNPFSSGYIILTMGDSNYPSSL